MSNRVIVVGSYNVDMTIVTDHLPAAGETVLGKELRYGHGGKGANQAVAALRAGGEVALIGRVGDDAYGEQAIADLHAEGLDVTGLKPLKGENTGLASISINAVGENSIIVISGANAKLTAADLDLETARIAAADTLLLQLESPMDTVRRAAEIAREHHVRVILNPAPACQLQADLLNLVSVITPNRVEAEMLTGIAIQNRDDMARAAHVFHDFGIPTVLITLGDQGVYCSHPGGECHQAALKVAARDTVGAGDVFNGFLAAQLQDEEQLPLALELAIAASALAVTRVGAQSAIPNLEAVQEFQRTRQPAESVT